MDNGTDLFDLSGCVYPVCRYACHRKCCQKTTSKCSKKVSRRGRCDFRWRPGDSGFHGVRRLYFCMSRSAQFSLKASRD